MTALPRRSVLAAFIALAATLPARGVTLVRRDHIHGTVTKIDRARKTFWIDHAPFASMPMEMTMEVRPVRAADLPELFVGEHVDLLVDTSIVPWPGTHIRHIR